MTMNAAQQRRQSRSRAKAPEANINEARSKHIRRAQQPKQIDPGPSEERRAMTEIAAHDYETQEFLSTAEGHPANDAAPRPRVGEIYRDRWNRSLIVLTLIGHDALVEYADGSLTRIDSDEWRMLKPRPHRF